MPRAYQELLLAQLGVADLEPLFARCHRLELAAGATLLTDQEPVDALYLLLEGRLAMAVAISDHAIQLGEIDPGNWVGEVALFSGSVHAVSTLTVVEDAVLMRLSFSDFAELTREAPEIACRLTHVLNAMLIQRLRATINDPILDPDGQLLLLGHLSLPLPTEQGHHGVRDFFRKLLGVTP